ncbi:MAG TPA: sucrase ferredoxin [Actinomycetales bacterium]|nr:sucrase ferredoxin [Actinomycetales bacterium]
MTVAVPRCSDAARERSDPLVGSASPARRWLLIEHPGPWATAALDSVGVAPAQKALVSAVVPGVTRILLVRRPGRQARDEKRVWTVLDHDAGQLASGTWGHAPDVRESPDRPDAGLLAAADALAHATSDDRPTDPAPLHRLLVCAHGRHDVCCAVRGRPVAAALASRWPEQTWECSHTGGDRFAANVVVLPDGVYYGQLDAVDAVAVVEAHLAGHVDVDHLRGFSTEPAPAQAALAEAHRRWGPAGARAFRTTSVTNDDGHWQVELAGAAGLPRRVTATVVRSPRPAARLTCRAVNEAVPLAFDVTGLEAHDA